MADLTSFITIAPSNSAIFTNSLNNDMLIYTESKTQKILIGTMSNVPAVLGVTSNTISVGATVIPVADVTYDLGTSNKRFRDLYLSGNTIDLGGTLLKKDTINGALSVTDSNGTYQSVIVSQLQVGNSSNVVTIQLDSNNQVQFVATSLSNGQSTGSNVASVGGWSNVGSNLVIIGSNVGVGKSNPERSIDTAGDINFDGILYKNGVPYIGSQWSNDSINVFLLESNVGIGTMNPLEKLEVAGNMKVESNAYIMSNAGIRTAFPAEALEVYNGNALIGCNLYAMSNLGIGTSNPSAALEVLGNAILRSNLTVEGTLTAINMNIVTSNILVYSNQIVNDTLVVLNRVALSNPSGYTYLDSSGPNVGLNTGSPTESFTIVGSNMSISNASGKSVITGSNSFIGVNKPAPGFTLDVGGDLNFDGMLRKGGVPYIGSQWSNNGSNVFMLGSNIGLGKSNPAYSLDTVGDINFDGMLRKGGVPYIGSQWSNNGSNVFLMGSNIGIYTQTPSEAIEIVGSNMKVGCNLYVLGNIGVGKSNPAYSFDTAGDINFGGILRQNGVPYIGSQWSNNGSNVFMLGSNIGIGVSNPTSALTIAGDIEVRSNILLTNQQFALRGVKLMKNSNSGGTTNVTTMVTAVPGYVYSSSNHVFSTTTNNYFSIVNGATETARFTGNNRLGLGTNNPGSTLDVNGDINFSGMLRQGGVPYIGSQWSNNSANVFLLASNVGIGTSAPTSALHLASNAAANVLVTLCNAATGARPATFGLTTTGDIALTAASNNSLVFTTSNVERLRITSNGYVGIGTSAPTSALNLASNAAAPVVITFCNTATGTQQAYTGLNAAGDLVAVAASNNNQIFYTSNVERMRISSNGFVGIGASAPTSALHLNSNAVAAVAITLCNSVTAGSPASLGVGINGELFHTTASNANQIFYTSNAERMRITSNGNVGIGTSAPTYNLSVAGTVYSSNVYAHNGLVGVPTTSVLGGAGDRVILWPGTATAQPFSLGINNATMWSSVPVNCQHQWFTNGNLGMALSNNLLGIGYANPSYILDVNGNSRVNGNVYLGTTGAYISSTTGTYGTVSVSGYAKGSWHGYDINTWFCYMANNNTSVGIHDNTNSWVFYYDKSDANNRYCNLYWGGGGNATNALRLQTTSYGVSVPNTLYIGLANFNTGTWHTSSDGKNRFHFTTNSHTYIGSQDTWRFQHPTNGDVAVINSAGGASFNGSVSSSGLQVGGGSGFRVSSTGHINLGDSYNNNNPGISIINGGGNISGYYATGYNIYSGPYNATRFMVDSIDGYVRIMASNNYPPYLGGASYLQIQINPSGGNVYIGSGGLTVNGSVSKTGGSFDIPHPDPEKSSQWRLRHCFVETPTRGDNIYTYKVTTTTDNEKFSIDLPDYFKHLNENPRTMVSCEEEDLLSRCCARVNIDLTQVKGMCEHPGTYVVMVIGTRKDQAMIDYFDNTGGVEYQLKGSDPRHPSFTQPSEHVSPDGSGTQ